MDSQRQQKINRLLQKELGEIFRVQMQPYFPGLMMTVMFVRVTSDLSLARVNLSLFPAPKEGKDAVLKAIKGHAAEIRYLLGRQVHDQLRILPQLQFFIDDTLDRVARIDELLAQ